MESSLNPHQGIHDPGVTEQLLKDYWTVARSGLEAPDQFGVWDHPLSSHGLPLPWNTPSPCPTIHLLLLQGLLLDKGSTKALRGPLPGPLRNACLEVAQATSFVSRGRDFYYRGPGQLEYLHCKLPHENH